MIRRFWFPLIAAILGAVVLVSLGTWQVKRLAWKQGVIAQMEAKLMQAPIALPVSVSFEQDRYRAVTTQGRFDGPAIKVLSSKKDEGAVYRHLAPFITTQGRRILVDRGYTAADAQAALAAGEFALSGHLIWPDDANNMTPDPDLEDHLWYGRDLPAMAAAYGTEGIMIVAQHATPADPHVTPWPVDTINIPNDHLQYAATWFSLAVIWIIMTTLYLRRAYRGSKDS